MSCTFRIAEVCRHPRLPRVEVTDAVCAGCARYAGPDRGLGDTVARLAKATGVARVVETASRVTGRPCGCQRRRETLNRLVPKLSTPTETKVDEFGEPK